MHAAIHGCRIELCQGDIALQRVDAIVNAANRHLAGGGGVDGAIHHRGGSAIMAETDHRYLDGCPTGSAVISGAGKLAAKYVIHAVGPVWSGGRRGEPELLARAYRRSLALAADHDCASVALPALSTGAYRYPMEEAAAVALRVAAEHLETFAKPAVVRFVLFDAFAYQVFADALRHLTSTR